MVVTYDVHAVGTRTVGKASQPMKINSEMDIEWSKVGGRWMMVSNHHHKGTMTLAGKAIKL